MNPPPSSGATALGIAAVERDTGLSKDTLRVWERRYGFPAPGRDAAGERSYPLDQVEKLRVVKRLLDAGHRPGRTVPLPMAALQALADPGIAAVPSAAPAMPGPEEWRTAVELLRRHHLAGLGQALRHRLSALGVARFVTEVVAPLNAAVGDAWMRGDIEVFQEHAYTELLQSLLRQAIGGIPSAAGLAGRPRVLLSTLPGEPHGLGLLMAEALLALEGCSCIPLGPQTPVWDLVQAARAYGVDIVALSHSGCLNPNQVVSHLTELAGRLEPGVQVWAGGSAPVLHRRAVPGVQALAGFDDLPARLQAWRDAAARRTEATTPPGHLEPAPPAPPGSPAFT